MANPKKPSRGWFLLALVPVCAAAIFFSVRLLSRTPPKIDAEKLVKVERTDLARSVVATGKIEPTTKVEIKSKASGIILKLPVNVGDRVRQGQVICELDQNDLLPRVRQAQATMARLHNCSPRDERAVRTVVFSEFERLPPFRRLLGHERAFVAGTRAAESRLHPGLAAPQSGTHFHHSL
jgi:HlyD family secretion protein